MAVIVTPSTESLGFPGQAVRAPGENRVVADEEEQVRRGERDELRGRGGRGAW